jgi:hypothetical protein
LFDPDSVSAYFYAVGLNQRKYWIVGVVVGIAAICFALWLIFFGSNRAPLSQREIATRVLAEYIRKTAKPRAVLLISNPYVPMASRTAEITRFHNSSEVGLREGMGSEIRVAVGFPKFKAEALRDVTSVYVPPNSTTPLSYLVSETSFDDLVREHPDCDILVTLIGLPASTASSAFWLKPGPPRVALLLPDFSVLGDAGAVRFGFESGKLLAAVIPKPNAPPERAIGSDYRAEFAKRFILVTGENVDQLLPQLLR